jgi:hypothetical protein
MLRVACGVIAVPVNGVTSALTRLGIRQTAPRSRREMAGSLFDEFAPRYQHHHDQHEVRSWFSSLGFADFAVCSVDRNGFGIRAVRRS